MAKTTADLIFGVRVYLDESQPADFTPAEVLSACNYRYHYVISKVMEVYEEFYLTVIPRYYSTVANQQQYVLDANFLKIERVEANYAPADAGSQPTRAVAIRLDEVPTNLNNSIINGSPISQIGYYILGAQNVQEIGFIPVPPNTATNNIAVWGTIAPADLVADSDVVHIPYPDLFSQVIIKLAAADLLKKGQQAVQAADDLMSEGSADVLNMQTFIKERQADGPAMIENVVWDDVSLGDYIW